MATATVQVQAQRPNDESITIGKLHIVRHTVSNYREAMDFADRIEEGIDRWKRGRMCRVDWDLDIRTLKSEDLIKLAEFFQRKINKGQLGEGFFWLDGERACTFFDGVLPGALPTGSIAVAGGLLKDIRLNYSTITNWVAYIDTTPLVTIPDEPIDTTKMPVSKVDPERWRALKEDLGINQAVVAERQRGLEALEAEEHRENEERRQKYLNSLLRRYGNCA